MSDTPQSRSHDLLPRQVDIRRLIAANVSLMASEPLTSFRRLGGMLEADTGSVEVQLHFFIDEQRLRRIDGAVQATVMVTCQRCLQPMPVAIDSRFAVAAVWNDEEGEHLPRHVDPYIVGEEPQDIRDLIEDELIISVPYVSYHSEGPCAEQAAQGDEAEPVAEERRENPFSVLGQLKPGKK
jgi:uncharacterized protein